MSRYSPSVLPTYSAPNIGQSITQALLQRDATNRQRDLDAVNTGIGLQPVDPNAPPEHSALSRLAGAVYSRITGHANGNDVEDANANMAAHAPSGMVSTTANEASGDPAMSAQPSKLPGAFDPMTGGFTPSQGSMMRLPSGQTVDMRYTPYGQRQEAREDTQAYNLNLRQMMIDAAMQRAESANQTREKIAADRNATTRDVAGQRITAMKELHGTPTGTAIFNATHRPTPRVSSASTRPSANASGSIGALTHTVAADKAAVLDLKQTMDAARKNPPSGRALLRQNPQADTTAILNGFRRDTTATRQELDAARARLQQHTAQLGAVAGGQHTPNNGTVTPTDGNRYIVQPDMDKAQQYEALRDQGYSHEDAIALLEGGQ